MPASFKNWIISEIIQDHYQNDEFWPSLLYNVVGLSFAINGNLRLCHYNAFKYNNHVSFVTVMSSYYAKKK
jgi:hypothetical protein